MSHSASPLVRAALMVRDLDRSRRFYEGFLGLSEMYLPPTDLTATAACRLLNLPPGASLRAVILKVPGPNYGMVGLFEIGNTHPVERAPRGDRVELGESVLVFNCANLLEKLPRLESFGARLISPPATFHVAGASFAPVTEAVLRDPDGFLVNLIGVDPSVAYESEPIRFGGHGNG